MFSADVVIWGSIPECECAVPYSYRLDREKLQVESRNPELGRPTKYRFQADLTLPAEAHSALLWALEAVPVSIKALQAIELGRKPDFVADAIGKYLEVHSKGHVWKVVLWKRPLPREVEPLLDYFHRLHTSLERFPHDLEIKTPRRRPFDAP